MRSIRQFSRLILLPAVLLAGFVCSASANAVSSDGGAADDGREIRQFLMEPVKSWGYQLQRLDAGALAASPFDLLVIDHAPDRVDSVEMLFRRSEIEPLKVKLDGKRRVVLAYMSIGEAERYRFYWDDKWLEKDSCPVWMGPVNPQWAGNYPVQYWEPQWQSLIFGQSDSYVDRVLEAGFDGIYLDRADVYDQFKSRPTAQADMVTFIGRLIDHARSINPAAIVVLQNAEELLRDKRIRERVDGAAKESLYFNADKAGEPIPPNEQQAAANDLRLMKRAGGKVMVVEYLDSAERAASARKKAQQDGFLIHFTERNLAKLSVRGPDELDLPAGVPVPVTAPVAAVSAVATDPQLVRASPCG